MAEYLVKVADERGRVLEQVENARSEAELRDRFTQQGYLVYYVKPRGLMAGGPRLRRRRVKQAQFVVFNQQFLTLIKAGLPILHALDLLIRRQRNAYFQALLNNVRDRVKSGESLSEAFEVQGVFPKIYTTTLLAGERSGNLQEVLGRYVGFERLVLSFRKKMISSLIYPGLLITFLIVMLTFLFVWVIPRFGELYAQLGRELPAITVAMLEVGRVAQNYFPFIAAGLAAALLLFWRWKKTEAGDRWFDNLRLSIPLLGGVWLKYQVAVFCRMMATLLAGGLPLVPSLETAAASMQSRQIARGIGEATQRVREGWPLSRGLEEHTQVPELAIEMVEVGESTGALPEMLTSVAEFYEEDVQNSLAAAMSLIEPIILIIMGVMVAFVLLSLYMPIFTLGAGGMR